MTGGDRAAIEEVIRCYGAALDARDADGILACFTPDVRLEYFDGAAVATGMEEARAFFRFDGGTSAPGLPGVDAIVSTTHLWDVGAIVVEEDRASAASSCVAYLLATSDGEGVLVTRGLRYHDELRRSEVGWRIQHRRHVPLWETRTAASPLVAQVSGSRP
jgi:hypothetical protein